MSTQKAGVGDPTSKSLGVAVLDYNSDGWPDIFVANDTQPNKLYRNNGNGTFVEEACRGRRRVRRRWRGARRDGRRFRRLRSLRPRRICWSAISPTRCSGCITTKAAGLFVDEAPRSPVGRASLLSLAFGVFFFDYDLDGYPDHLRRQRAHRRRDRARSAEDRVQAAAAAVPQYREGAVREASSAVGPDLIRPIVARGAAYADFDRDGDLDLLVTDNHGPAHLFRNDGGNANHWVRLKLTGTKSNRSALGAVVRIESASGKQWQTVHSGSSYCSQSDLALTFGLGKDAVTAIEVFWPSGAKQRFTNVKANTNYTIDENRGLTP